MAIQEVFRIIEENIEEADFCEPISEDKIDLAEDILNVKYPTSYRFFLQNYGAGDIFGIEFYGIINDPENDLSAVPNGVWLTQNLREELGMSSDLIIVSETGDGLYYVLDTSEKDSNNESPVYLWQVNIKEKVANSFGEFALELLREMID